MFTHFRLVAVSCDCYITTGSGIMYHYKAAQLLLYAQLFHTLDCLHRGTEASFWGWEYGY